MKKTLFSLAALGVIALSSMSASAADPEITVIAEADFTVITAGTPQEPVAFPAYGTGSFTTLFPSWGQSKTMQAGGQILIQDGGYVSSPYKDMSAHGGTVRVTAQVKAMDDYGGIVKCTAGYGTSQMVMLEDQEWHTIEAVLSGGTSFSRITVEPFLCASGILVKNIKVDQSASFIAAPTVYQPSQADDTSFTARWKAVTGATEYFLDVYTKTATGQKEYLTGYENKSVTGTSLKVTGLDATKTYYYCMRASNGTGVSANSEEIRVVKIISYLAAPTGLTGDGGHKTYIEFRWNSVTNAQAYAVNITRVEKLPTAKDVDILNEQFVKATLGTLDNIEFIMYPDRYTTTPGWDGAELGTANGVMVLSPMTGYPSWLSTPALDMSNSDGNFSVKLNMAEGRWGTMYQGGIVEVMLINAAGDTLQNKTVTIDSKDFKEYTVAMTGGTANAKVSVRYSGENKIFIEGMAVSQFCPAGTIVRTFAKQDQTENCSYRYDFERNDAVTYSVNVQAAAETVSAGEIVWLYSDPCQSIAIDPNSDSVEAVTTGQTSVTARNGIIEVTTTAETPVSVYTLTGACLLSAQLNAGTTTLPVNTTGVLLVKVGNKTFKVAL